MTAIVLVGLMGSGKSTVGRLLADRLGRRLVDSDTEIERLTGSTVRELWESGGEDAYRSLESRIVLDTIDEEPPVVIAAPGGVVLDPHVRDAMGRAFVVWLRADPALLASRVRVDDHRPLLGTDPLGVLTAMAVDRAGLYASVADMTVDVDDLGPDQIVERILSARTAVGDGTTGPVT